MLKRSPDVVLASLHAFVAAASLDFSRYTDLFLPPILAELQQTSDSRRETAVNLLTAVSTKTSDPSAIGRIIEALTSSLVNPKSKSLRTWNVRVTYAITIARLGNTSIAVGSALTDVVNSCVNDLTVQNYFPTVC